MLEGFVVKITQAEERLRAYAELNAMRIDASQIDAYMTEDKEPDYFTDLGSLYEELVDAFDRKKRNAAPRLPYSHTFADFQLRPNELTVWFGIDGHGKSMMASHVMLDLMAQGERCAMASLEMPLPKTAKRLAQQAIGNPDPTLDALRQFCRWGHGRLWFYREPGMLRIERMYAAIRYAVKVLKVRHFFLDNLTNMLRDDDDNSEQKHIIQRLAVMARDLGAHIHLIAHAKKLEDETRVPSRSSLKGSGSLLAESDNVLIVWKNTKPSEQRDPNFACDAVLVVAKQRHHDGEGKDTFSTGLWFDQRSYQFKDFEAQSARKYVTVQREAGED